MTPKQKPANAVEVIAKTEGCDFPTSSKGMQIGLRLQKFQNKSQFESKAFCWYIYRRLTCLDCNTGRYVDTVQPNFLEVRLQ